MKPLMKCGHVANAVTTNEAGEQVPSCAICAGISPGATVVDQEAPSLDGRVARCYCGAEKPSAYDLAFFEYRGAGSSSALLCECGYTRGAHEREGASRRVCNDYTPRGDIGSDSFYCGCRGWD